MSSHLRLPGMGGGREYGRSAGFGAAPETSRHDEHPPLSQIAESMVFTIGPETAAPVAEIDCLGTTTAIATLGSLAGAKAIIQSVVAVFPVPT